MPMVVPRSCRPDARGWPIPAGCPGMLNQVHDQYRIRFHRNDRIPDHGCVSYSCLSRPAFGSRLGAEAAAFPGFPARSVQSSRILSSSDDSPRLDDAGPDVMHAPSIDPALLTGFDVVQARYVEELDGTSRVNERVAESRRVYRYQLQDRALWRMRFERPIFNLATRGAGSIMASFAESRFATGVAVEGDEGDLFCFTSMLRGGTILIRDGDSTTATPGRGLAWRPGPGTRLLLSDGAARANLFFRVAEIEEALEHMLDDRLRRPIEFAPSLDWSAGLAASLKAQLDFVLHEFTRAGRPGGECRGPRLHDRPAGHADPARRAAQLQRPSGAGPQRRGPRLCPARGGLHARALRGADPHGRGRRRGRMQRANPERGVPELPRQHAARRPCTTSGWSGSMPSCAPARAAPRSRRSPAATASPIRRGSARPSAAVSARRRPSSSSAPRAEASSYRDVVPTSRPCAS